MPSYNRDRNLAIAMYASLWALYGLITVFKG
jgi:hypothetical protein